jgi:hypothetical protein
MSFSTANQPRDILLGRLAITTLEVLAAEFAERVLRGDVRPCLDDELEAYGERVAERIPALCRELIEEIRAYENYEHQRREEQEDINDIPF